MVDKVSERLQLPEHLVNDEYLNFLVFNEELIDILEKAANNTSTTGSYLKGTLTGPATDLGAFKEIVSNYCHDNGFRPIDCQDPRVLRFCFPTNDTNVDVFVSPV